MVKIWRGISTFRIMAANDVIVFDASTSESDSSPVKVGMMMST